VVVLVLRLQQLLGLLLGLLLLRRLQSGRQDVLQRLRLRLQGARSSGGHWGPRRRQLH
jgi:hypothetical protein